MSWGALAFLNPWLLGALAALPVIYWLLRTVPPRPRQITFPPTRILVGLENKEKTPAKSPWWLMLIRLLAAAAIIFALAEPVLNPSREAALEGNGPVAIVVDNGWSACPALGGARAHDRPRDRRGRRAGPRRRRSRRRRAWSRLPTARIEAPAEARSTAAAFEPQPFAPDRPAAAQGAAGRARPRHRRAEHRLAERRHRSRRQGGRVRARSRARWRARARSRSSTAAAARRRSGCRPASAQSGKLEARVLRAGGPARPGFVHAYSARGQRLGEAPFTLATGAPSQTIPLELPLELRNQVARVEIAGERSAGAVSLLDSRSQWHRVALISGESREQAQPLLAPLYYIEKALTPYSRARAAEGLQPLAGINDAFAQNASVLMLADIGTLSGEAKSEGRGLGEARRRAGALCRAAAGERRRRRPAAGAAARRRPHARRRAVVVDAAAARIDSRTRACSPASIVPRKSPSTARCSPTRRCSAPT